MSVDTRSLVKKLDALSLKALEAAINLAVANKMPEVGIEHWCYKIVEGQNSSFRQLLVKAEVDPEDFLKAIRPEACLSHGSHHGVPALSSALTTLIHDAWMLSSVDFQAQEISSGHLFLALASNLNGFYLGALAKALLRNVDVDQLKQYLKVSSESEDGPDIPASGALARFTTDFLALAKQHKIDRAIGRNREITQIIDVLCRRKQSNPVLVGESGVGKTAIVEELAFCMLEGNVPKELKGASLKSLDFASLQAGANVQGEFESRVKDLLEAVQQSSSKVILFIDEIHNFLGASGRAADCANLLKPALSSGLSVIGATTWAEYKKSFEKDAALSRRFQLIKVLEPSESVALDIVRKVSGNLEKHHQVNIQDSALENAVSLSVRYMSHQRLPDKAIALLDSACARVQLQQSLPPLLVRNLEEKIELNKYLLARLERELQVDPDKKAILIESIAALERQHAAELSSWKDQLGLIVQLKKARAEGLQEEYLAKSKDLAALRHGEIKVYESVDGDVVADLLSEWTNIPISSVGNEEELQALLSFDDKIKQRVVGQDHAIEMIVNAVRISKANLANPNKPIAVFLLVGESGVGKTETALSLAETVYGHESKIITINMSEYKEGHKVATLIGSPPGYVGYGEGGRLTEKVRRNPYSVILLDEIEKAHSNVQDLFLQVFDKGSLTDSEGVEVDFRNTLIILTSNLGSKVIRDFCGAILNEDEESKELKSRDEGGEVAAQIPNEKEPDLETDISQEETKEAESEDSEAQLQERKSQLSGQEDARSAAKASLQEKIGVEGMERLLQMLQSELLKSLKPEFIGRLTVVPYFSLDKEVLEGIIKIQFGKLARLLKEHHKAQLTYTNEAVTKILEACKVSPIGARQIEKIISSEILPDLSIAVLEIRSKGMSFGKVELSVKEGEFAMDIRDLC